uniref:Uncharacterized protein n=1 Tax=Mycena chlorophos TaxID=658473 RepID=A0ABQ0LPA1_MYCCL|nr:predicted protein [Mycena chlorophos]
MAVGSPTRKVRRLDGSPDLKIWDSLLILSEISSLAEKVALSARRHVSSAPFDCYQNFAWAVEELASATWRPTLKNEPPKGGTFPVWEPWGKLPDSESAFTICISGAPSLQLAKRRFPDVTDLFRKRGHGFLSLVSNHLCLSHTHTRIHSPGMARQKTRLTQEDMKTSQLAYSRRYEASEKGKQKRKECASRKHRRKQLPLSLDRLVPAADEDILAESDFTPPRREPEFQQSLRGECGRLYPYIMIPPYSADSLENNAETRDLRKLGFKLHGRLMAWEGEEEAMWVEELRCGLWTRRELLEKWAAEAERRHERWLDMKALDEAGYDEKSTFGRISAALTKIHRAWAARRFVRLRQLSFVEEM